MDKMSWKLLIQVKELLRRCIFLVRQIWFLLRAVHLRQGKLGRRKDIARGVYIWCFRTMRERSVPKPLQCHHRLGWDPAPRLPTVCYSRVNEVVSVLIRRTGLMSMKLQIPYVGDGEFQVLQAEKNVLATKNSSRFFV